MSMNFRVLPFLLALIGVLSDYITTTIGLSTGFYETHLQYHPIWGFLYFMGTITILTLALPRKKPWTLGINGLALASYIGTVNNTLVIWGIFPGLQN